MTEKEVCSKLEILYDKSLEDREVAYLKADDVLSQFLKSLGYTNVIEEEYKYEVEIKEDMK